MNLLIPYVKLPNHHDPLLEEFTYGDVNKRGAKLKTLRPGNLVFFHTTIQGTNYVTACYTVAQVMDTKDVVKDPDLVRKYRNPHIARWLEEGESERDDVMVFGDPSTSTFLTKPLPFDRKLVKQLSLDIGFKKGLTECQAIAFATREWRELTEDDVRILQKAMRVYEASDDSRLTGDGVDNSAVEALERSHAKSQGFNLDSKLRKVLETHAMKAAKKHFEAQGYTWDDHSKTHPYDLRCTRKKEVLYVEVKGTQTDGTEIILTQGEVAFARKHKGQMALFVLHSIPVSKVSGLYLLGVGKRKLTQPWDVDHGTLKPLAFKYEL